MTKEERIRNWNDNFKKWNAFNDDLETFIVIGNTFDIKDELKKKGAKFSPELGWHFNHEEPGYILEKVTYKEVGKSMPDGKLILDYENAPSFIRKLQEKHLKPTNSEWVGEIGEKRTFWVTLKDSHGYSGAFGYSHILTFKDEYDNTIVWFSTSGKEYEKDKEYVLTGTIKAHKIFREDKQTVVSRCKCKRI